MDIRELDLPFYQPGMVEVPPAVERLCVAVYRGGGMLWSSPLYHGTISGAFKNALDWLQLLSDRQPPYLTDNVVGLISTAGGTQGLQAVNTMEFVVRSLRGWAVPLVIPVPRAWQVLDHEGHARDQGDRRSAPCPGPRGGAGGPPVRRRAGTHHGGRRRRREGAAAAV